MSDAPLAGRVVLMSGGSRGIGLAIAKRIAADGAKVAIMAKTAEPHPKLPGTIYTAAEEIESAGGEALPIVGDVRDDAQVEAAVAQTVEKFGGVDIVVNNASAINLAPIANLEPKRYDLMLDINTRGTFLLTRAALPHLRESDHAHVLTLSPPLSADPKWLQNNAAYTVSKMGMTMLTLGLAADEAEHGVGANCLWPRTIIATAAVQNLLGGDEAMARARTPEIYADAAYEIVSPRPARVHRQRVHRRRGARRGRGHRLLEVRTPARARVSWCSTCSSTSGGRQRLEGRERYALIAIDELDPAIQELHWILARRGVDPQRYSLEGGLPDECTCLETLPDGRWAVYYSEQRPPRPARPSYYDARDAVEAMRDRLGV